MSAVFSLRRVLLAVGVLVAAAGSTQAQNPTVFIRNDSGTIVTVYYRFVRVGDSPVLQLYDTFRLQPNESKLLISNDRNKDRIRLRFSRGNDTTRNIELNTKSVPDDKKEEPNEAARYVFEKTKSGHCINIYGLENDPDEEDVAVE